jgi:2-polyprenyl-6-methoxyphenol hydroxylase-like FAD-dependent oxidoreductase
MDQPGEINQGRGEKENVQAKENHTKARMTRNDFAIIGGGIGGLTLAIAMRKKGFDVTVYEAAPRLKPVGAGLGLAGNAMKAFEEIGMDKEILRVSQVLQKVSIMDHRGRQLMVTDSEKISRTYGVVNNFAIHRADLHNILLRQLPPEIVQLGKSLERLQQGADHVILHFRDGSQVEAGYAIAADGIHSPVRAQFLPKAIPRYAGYTCWRAIVDDVPPDFDSSQTSESWGRGERFGIVPLSGNRVYWFACINARPNDEIMRSLSPADLLTYFGDFHAPVPELIRRTKKEALVWNDIIDLPPLDRFAFGNVVLMGDAAHATTPNMGQGACMAIEDAVVLSNCLSSGANPEDAFRRFEEKRLLRTSKIIRDSWQIGKIAQLENPVLSGLRNLALRLTPAGVAEKQLRFIYDVTFN